MPNNTILFDIDKTLIDTPALFNEQILPELAKSCQESTKVLHTALIEYRDTYEHRADFNPQHLIEQLAQKFSVDKQELAKVLYDERHFKTALYPEAIDVLEELKKKHPLGTFTEALPSWQIDKMKLSGVYEYFDEKLIFLAERKTTDEFLGKLPKDAYIIEDRVEIVELLERKKIGKAIWINRVDQSKHKTIKTIHSLTELIDSLE